MNQSLNLHGLSMARIALAMWNQKDVQERLHRLILDDRLLEIRIRLHTITRQLINSVDTFSFPPILKPILKRFIAALSTQVFKWKLYTQETLGDMSYADDIRITSQGTLDVSTMIMNWLNDCNIDLSIRFNLACDHCLKTKIIELWSELPQLHKDSFLKDCDDLKTTWRRKNKITYYWMMYFSQNNNIYKTYHKHLLIMALEGDELRLPAAQYFWSLLKQDEQIKCLKKVYSPTKNTIHFYHLLNKTGQITPVPADTNWYAITNKLWFCKIESIFENELILIDTFLSYIDLKELTQMIDEECKYLTDCNFSQGIKLLRYLWSHSQVVSKKIDLRKFYFTPSYSCLMRPDGVVTDEDLDIAESMKLFIVTLFYHGDAETIIQILNDEATNSFVTLKRNFLLCILDKAFTNVPLFLEILQKVTNPVELKAFMCKMEQESNEICIKLLLVNKYTEADEFLNFVLPNQNNRQKFKQRFIKIYVYSLFKIILQSWYKYQDLKLFDKECRQIVHWLMMSEEDIKIFWLRFCKWIDTESEFSDTDSDSVHFWTLKRLRKIICDWYLRNDSDD